MCSLFYSTFIHNNKLDFGIQEDLKRKEENMETRKLKWERACKLTTVLELSGVTVEILLVLQFLDPKSLLGFHNSISSFTSWSHMFAYRPLSIGSAYEKLGTLCVWARNYHVQDSRTCMLQAEFFILKFPF